MKFPRGRENVREKRSNINWNGDVKSGYFFSLFPIHDHTISEYGMWRSRQLHGNMLHSKGMHQS